MRIRPRLLRLTRQPRPRRVARQQLHYFLRSEPFVMAPQSKRHGSLMTPSKSSDLNSHLGRSCYYELAYTPTKGASLFTVRCSSRRADNDQNIEFPHPPRRSICQLFLYQAPKRWFQRSSRKASNHIAIQVSTFTGNQNSVAISPYTVRVFSVKNLCT